MIDATIESIAREQQMLAGEIGELNEFLADTVEMLALDVDVYKQIHDMANLLQVPPGRFMSPSDEIRLSEILSERELIRVKAETCFSYAHEGIKACSGAIDELSAYMIAYLEFMEDASGKLASTDDLYLDRLKLQFTIYTGPGNGSAEDSEDVIELMGIDDKALIEKYRSLLRKRKTIKRSIAKAEKALDCIPSF